MPMRRSKIKKKNERQTLIRMKSHWNLTHQWTATCSTMQQLPGTDLIVMKCMSHWNLQTKIRGSFISNGQVNNPVWSNFYHFGQRPEKNNWKGGDIYDGMWWGRKHGWWAMVRHSYSPHGSQEARVYQKRTLIYPTSIPRTHFFWWV